MVVPEVHLALDLFVAYILIVVSLVVNSVIGHAYFVPMATLILIVRYYMHLDKSYCLGIPFVTFVALVWLVKLMELVMLEILVLIELLSRDQ